MNRGLVVLALGRPLGHEALEGTNAFLLLGYRKGVSEGEFRGEDPGMSIQLVEMYWKVRLFLPLVLFGVQWMIMCDHGRHVLNTTGRRWRAFLSLGSNCLAGVGYEARRGEVIAPEPVAGQRHSQDSDVPVCFWSPSPVDPWSQRLALCRACQLPKCFPSRSPV